MFSNRTSQTLHAAHRAAVALMERLDALIAASRTRPPDTTAPETVQLPRELVGCERMFAHVQNEEMALLPLIGELMDGELEARFHKEYVENG